MNDFTSENRAFREAWHTIKDNQEALFEELVEKNAALGRELDKKSREITVQTRTNSDLKRKFERVDIALRENRYIVVLIDSEALPFTDDYLLRPGGGQLAAGDLIHEARKMASEKLGGTERGLQYLPVHVYAFGDLESVKIRGELSVREMRSFVGGFNRFEDTVNWVDLGGGMDGEEVKGVCDGKIENLTRFHLQNPNCVLLVLGINQDDQRTHNFIGSSSVTRNNDYVQRVLLVGEKVSGLNLPYDRPQVSQNLFRIKQQSRLPRALASKWQTKPRPGDRDGAGDVGDNFRRDSGYLDGHDHSSHSSSGGAAGLRSNRHREFYERERNSSNQHSVEDNDSNHGNGHYDSTIEFKPRLQQTKTTARTRHPPQITKPSDEDFDAFKLLKPNPCKEHYLNTQHGCRKSTCIYSHNHSLSPPQLQVLKFYAQLTRCKFGDDCTREDCYNGHWCGNIVESAGGVLAEDGKKRYVCKRSKCPFSEEEHPPGCIIPTPGYRSGRYNELDDDGEEGGTDEKPDDQDEDGWKTVRTGLKSRGAAALRGRIVAPGPSAASRNRKYFPDSVWGGEGEERNWSGNEAGEKDGEEEQEAEDDGWGVKKNKISEDFPDWNSVAAGGEVTKNEDEGPWVYGDGENEEPKKGAGSKVKEKKKAKGEVIEEDLLG